jgi:uncharacterized protein (DUF111 family)
VQGAPVRVKVAQRNGVVTTMAVEHDDAVRATTDTGLPLKQVYALARRAAEDALVDPAPGGKEPTL